MAGIIRSQTSDGLLSPGGTAGSVASAGSVAHENSPADNAFLAAVLANSCDLVMVIDECASLVYANAISERTLGLWADEIVGRNLLDFVHPEDVGTAARRLMECIDNGTSIGVPLDVSVRHSSNTWNRIEILAANLTDDPSVRGIVINARLVPNGGTASGVVGAAQESFRQAFQRSPIGMAITTLEGKYVRANPSLCDLLGVTSEELMASSVLETTHPDDLRATVDCAISLLDGHTTSFSLEKRFLARDGRAVWTRATTTLLRDGEDNAVQFLTQVEDIEERHQLIEELRISALRDPLTGLANRAGLSEYISSLDGGLEIGVVAVDLDRFKIVNDSAGHAVGDEVLRVVAERINGSIRSADHAARIGGDEFVVVFAEPRSAEELASLASRLIRDVEMPISIDGGTISVGASAGTSVGPAARASEVMVAADHASYQAKRSGLDVVAGSVMGAE